MTLFDNFKRLFGSGPAAPSREISCGDALRLVNEFIDGELDGVSQVEVEAHFELCKRCYPHLRLEQQFREAVRRACTCETAPPELRSRVRDMVSEARPDA